VKAENLYHTGIVVDDLEATMKWLSEVAGYTWTDVVTVEQQGVTPDGEITIPMKMAYSGSDPRLELLQTVPNTVWTPAAQVSTTSAIGPTTSNPTWRHWNRRA